MCGGASLRPCSSFAAAIVLAQVTFAADTVVFGPRTYASAGPQRERLEFGRTGTQGADRGTRPERNWPNQEPRTKNREPER